jgi:hypothetical protein
MDLTKEQEKLREHYVLALIETTLPLQKESDDPEITMKLLIEATDMLKRHLLKELEEMRGESD